jgi:hypothetical protein
MIDYAVIEKLHAAARRERSQHVYRLIVRAKLWLLARLPRAGARLRAEQCR